MSAAEGHGDALTSTTASDGRSALTVDLSGLQTHPVVAAVLAETPVNFEGQVFLEETSAGGHLGSWWGAPEPIAARQAAAVLRWLAATPAWTPMVGDGAPYWRTRDLEVLADEIDSPSGGESRNNTTTPKAE